MISLHRLCSAAPPFILTPLGSPPLEPSNPLAAHIGNGTVLLSWTETNASLVDHYQVWASEDAVNYFQYMNAEFQGDRAMIHNVPIGITAYLKIRAIGIDGRISNFVDFQAATIQKPSKQFMIRAIDGSLIRQGAVFSVLDMSGRIVAIQAVADIPITC